MLKAFFTISWFKGKNPLLIALTATWELEKINARFLAAAIPNVTVRAITFTLNVLV